MYRAALQKSFVLLMILALPIFILKQHKIFRDRTAYVAQKKVDSAPEIVDKHFAVVIPLGINNEKLGKNLEHLLGQNYPNFEIIFIGTENNRQIVNEVESVYSLTRKELSDMGQTQFPSFSVQRSYYDAIHSLQDDTIVIHMELSDWLGRSNIFEKLAQTFTNSDVWLAYSPYIDYPSYSKQLDHPDKEEKWWKLHNRKTEWMSSPLKIFYAGLFKEVKFDLIDPKQLKPRLQLSVFLLPMAEKAKKHIWYIKDTLYYHDSRNENSQDTLVYLPSF